MTRLSTIAATYRPPLTSAQLRSRIGQPLTPCPTCGSAIYSILHDGSLVCAGCDWALATGPACAIPVVVLLDADGVSRAYDRREALQSLQEARRIDAGAYWLDLPDLSAERGRTPEAQQERPQRARQAKQARRIRVIPARPPRCGGWDCPRDMLLDDWFESLPILTNEHFSK